MSMIAYCGLNCGECPTYLATQNNDEVLRAKTATEWSKMFNHAFKPEDLVCDGCRAEGGRKFGFCAQCQVRACAKEEKLENCAHCQGYPCGKLEPMFAVDSKIKDNLDRIRASL